MTTTFVKKNTSTQLMPPKFSDLFFLVNGKQNCFKNVFAIMLPIFVRTERVWPKLSSIQGIRANLVYIVSLLHFTKKTSNSLIVICSRSSAVSLRDLFATDFEKVNKLSHRKVQTLNHATFLNFEILIIMVDMDGVKSLANKKKDHHILQLKLSNDL